MIIEYQNIYLIIFILYIYIKFVIVLYDLDKIIALHELEKKYNLSQLSKQEHRKKEKEIKERKLFDIMLMFIFWPFLGLYIIYNGFKSIISIIKGNKCLV